MSHLSHVAFVARITKKQQTFGFYLNLVRLFSSIVQYFVAKIEQTEKYSKNFESIFLLIQKYLEINTNCFGISLYFHYLCINI